jgi:hypothetical protein
MKNILKLSFLFILGLAVFASCAKRNPDNTPPSGTTNSMSGTIGGNAWTAATITVNVDTNLVEIDMIGTSSTNSYVAVELPEHIAAGTYDQNIGTIEFYYDATHYYFLTTGTVKVTSNTGSVISGNFSGTMTNPSTMVTTTATAVNFTVKYK